MKAKQSVVDLLFNNFKSLSLKPANASSLGAKRVNPPSVLSSSVSPATSISDKKILQQKEEEKKTGLL